MNTSKIDSKDEITKESESMFGGGRAAMTL